MSNKLLGHTPDGQPVKTWEPVNAWTGKKQSFLEVGHTLIELDHIDPALEDAVRASLKRGVS